jgi:hypothetical protein
LRRGVLGGPRWPTEGRAYWDATWTWIADKTRRRAKPMTAPGRQVGLAAEAGSRDYQMSLVVVDPA